MGEKKNLLINIKKVSIPDLSRQFHLLLISIFFIQFLCIPAFAQSVEFREGYNEITYDNGSKDIINGALNFLRWDGAWRPNEELNISNGSWPYLYTQNATTADFKVDDATLSIPKANTVFKTNLNSISYELKYTKSELQEKGISINKIRELIDIPYHLKSRKPKKEFKDRQNIKYGRFHFRAGMEHIVVHDDTPRDYLEDGKVFQDVTYLFPPDYEFKIENGTIQLVFNNNALDKLTGNVIVEIRTWDIIGASNWGGNVAFSQASDVKATGNVELKQTVADYSLYTRFDEGTGKIIHNENVLNRPLGDLLGAVGTGTYTSGKYGNAIHFNGIDNKVLFNDHPNFRLPGDFTISYYIKLTSDVSNADSDITRKGSTATANPDSWWKIELTKNLMHGSVTKNGAKAVESYDTVDRRDGNWHFVAYTRGGTTCSLIVDGTTVKTTSNCPTNAVNTARLSIGSKDTYVQTSGLDFTHGTIDEVRIFNRKLSASELTSIRNNAHNTAGTVTRNLVSVIKTGEEIKELGCYGTWDSSITKVNVMASADNINWATIRSNAAPNVNYAVNTGNNYKYSRCSLSTTDSSKTPIIQSIRANIGLKGSSSSYTISVSTSPPGLTPQPAGGGQYNSGQTATVTAQSVNGYTFQRWTEGANQVSTSASYPFTVTGNRNLVAVYVQNTGSLAGWWKFNNENGETSSLFRDWSNNGNTATCISTSCPTLTAGKSGNALYFDGSNDYISAGNSASLGITGNITVEAWIKPGRLETAYLVKKASSGSTDGYELSLSSSTGKAYFRVNGKTSGNTYKLFSTSKFPVDGNTWVHLAGVYDKNKLQIYFNGNLENSMTGPANILSNTDNLEFGGPDDSKYFKGTIDEVRIWNRALIPEEIKASYNSGI